MAQLNCQGLLSKLDKLKEIILQVWKCDMVFFSETWLQPSCTTDSHLSLLHFSYFRRDRRESKHGVLIVYVRTGTVIEAYRRTDLEFGRYGRCVDACNAFNALNRKAALWHARHLWPRGCRFLFNTYKGWASLVLVGSPSLLFSKEGTTQGDLLAMAFYAVGVLSLIQNLKDFQKWTFRNGCQLRP